MDNWHLAKAIIIFIGVLYFAPESGASPHSNLYIVAPRL